MLRGRLGLETARIPHADRHGLLWLSRGALTVRDGTLRFERQAGPDSGSPLDSGEYGIPFQSLSMILLGPGSTVSHDALRLMARHGTALVAVGEDGVRCYTAPPLMPDTSDIARRQMRAWGDPDGSRITVARKMYALRLGEVLPASESRRPERNRGCPDEADVPELGPAIWHHLAGSSLRPDQPAGRGYPESGYQPRICCSNLGGVDRRNRSRGHSSTGLHTRAQR